MKNRNLNHGDNWATPPLLYRELDKRYGFTFDPCPFNHDINKWDGRIIEWGFCNFVNPPYSRQLKEAFVNKAVEEADKGKQCILLLPVSTSTKLFHDVVQPKARKIEFLKGRVPFIGINTKGEYVNWHLWGQKAPENAIHVKNSGMHDSMIVVFDRRKE